MAGQSFDGWRYSFAPIGDLALLGGVSGPIRVAAQKFLGDWRSKSTIVRGTMRARLDGLSARTRMLLVLAVIVIAALIIVYS